MLAFNVSIINYKLSIKLIIEEMNETALDLFEIKCKAYWNNVCLIRLITGSKIHKWTGDMKLGHLRTVST